MNIGKDAGQTIFHCHIHIIPRRQGDTQNPKGGVRGVIPLKQNIEHLDSLFDLNYFFLLFQVPPY